MVATRCVELERHDKLSKTKAEPDILILRSMHQSPAGLDLALRKMPVAYDPTAAGRVRQMRIRPDKTGNFRLHRLPK